MTSSRNAPMAPPSSDNIPLGYLSEEVGGGDVRWDDGCESSVVRAKSKPCHSE